MNFILIFTKSYRDASSCLLHLIIEQLVLKIVDKERQQKRIGSFKVSKGLS